MTTKSEKWFLVLVASAAVAILAACASGCSTLDKAYKQEVSWTNAPTVQVVTNTVVVTNLVRQVEERTRVVYVTNAETAEVSGYVAREPVATNLVQAVVTNFVPIYYTNFVREAVTNLVERPEVLAAIGTGGSLIDRFVPGVGSIVALALGGLYHAYRQVRNKKVNEALVQGVETAREVLSTTPQGQAADALFVKWLMEHQKEAGVFATVSELVEELTDNPAAKMVAGEIAGRVQSALSQPAKVA